VVVGGTDADALIPMAGRSTNRFVRHDFRALGIDPYAEFDLPGFPRSIASKKRPNPSPKSWRETRKEEDHIAAHRGARPRRPTGCSRLYAACMDGRVYEIIPETDKVTPFAEGHASFASVAVLLPDGAMLISGGYDGCLCWHDTAQRSSSGA